MVNRLNYQEHAANKRFKHIGCYVRKSQARFRIHLALKHGLHIFGERPPAGYQGEGVKAWVLPTSEHLRRCIRREELRIESLETPGLLMSRILSWARSFSDDM